MNENKLRAAIAQNPVLVLLLGACPALAATTAVLPALTLGVTALAVMLLASLFSSLIKKLLPANTLFIAQFMLVAGFASMAQLLLNAWLPKVYNMLGVYAALLAVDALIFSESERAAQQSVGAALKDSFLTGLGFIAALFVTAAIREIFGAGSFAGITLDFFKAHSVSLLTSPAGGFFVLAIVMAVVSAVSKKSTATFGGTADAIISACAEKKEA